MSKPNVRAGTTSSILKAARNVALGTIEPPAHVHLRECDLPFWKSIIDARSRDRWLTVDLEHAANLARCKADIERIQQEIEKEGDVFQAKRSTRTTHTKGGSLIVDERPGDFVVNPKHQLIEMLVKRSSALSRLIRVNIVDPVAVEAKDNQVFHDTKELLNNTTNSTGSLIPTLTFVK